VLNLEPTVLSGGRQEILRVEGREHVRVFCIQCQQRCCKANQASCSIRIRHDGIYFGKHEGCCPGHEANAKTRYGLIEWY